MYYLLAAQPRRPHAPACGRHKAIAAASYGLMGRSAPITSPASLPALALQPEALGTDGRAGKGFCAGIFSTNYEEAAPPRPSISPMR